MNIKSSRYIRLISFFVAVTVLFSLICVVPASAESTVGYSISGSASGSDFTVTVAIENVRAYAGRIALAFDTEMLELADDSSLGAAIKRDNSIVLSSEGHDNSVLVSNPEGYVMFAWYVSANTAVNALGSPLTIATIPFKIKPGYSTDDFSRNTLGIRYINDYMLENWSSGAEIVSSTLNKYAINSINEDYVCNVRFDYPNCDVIPIVYYNAVLNVTDLNGNPLSGADVRIDDMRTTTDLGGSAVYQLADGIYGYRVQVFGYQTQSGYITVNGADVAKTVMLKNYAQMVQSTAAELEIEFNTGDDAGNVTSGIGLLDVGPNGETITWESSNSSVVTNQGIVLRQSSDVNVVMTATVTMGTSSAQKTFYLTVRSKNTADLTNDTIVSMDAESLDITFAPGDSMNSVTSDILLPEVGSYGSGIVWQVSHPEIIDVYGAVTRPSVDTNVRLTATIMRGDASTEKSFTVVVKAAQATGKPDAELVADVSSLLQIGYAEGDSAASVTKSLTLPVSGAYGTEIYWSSSLPAVVTSYGGVNRQHTDTSVTLTANVVKGSASQQKQFTITVKAADTTPDNPIVGPDKDANDAEIVAADKNNLKIIYAPGDSASSVTSNLTLPSLGDRGSSIFWQSSDANVISSNGTVTRQSTDADVTLTAILSKGNSTATATFGVKVKAQNASSSESDTDIVNRVAEALDIVYRGGDNAGRVTLSVGLPTKGAEDTSISWQSSNTDVISTNGNVTRKNSNMNVTLTATVTRGTAKAQKSFDVTVIAAQKPSGSSTVGDEGVILPSASPTPTVQPGDPTSNSRFNDIETVPWAKEAILALAQIGVIKGTSDTTFSPNDPISRGDYVTLLVRLLGLNADLGEGFSDVPVESYYYQTITTAKTLGIIDGVGNNMFEPESSISRQDMMTMTYRALSRLGMTADWQPSDLSEFGDANMVSDYALESVQYVVGGGLIAGDENGNIAPLANTTRAETAVFLYRLSVQ